MCMNQIAKVDRNAFLSESESIKLFVSFWRRFHFSFPGLQMSEIDQSIDLDKDCYQFA